MSNILYTFNIYLIPQWKQSVVIFCRRIPFKITSESPFPKKVSKRKTTAWLYNRVYTFIKWWNRECILFSSFSIFISRTWSRICRKDRDSLQYISYNVTCIPPRFYKTFDILVVFGCSTRIVMRWNFIDRIRLTRFVVITFRVF